MATIAAHKETFLNQKNIPFKNIGFGFQIDRKYYDQNIFNYHNVTFLDTTFILNF